MWIQAASALLLLSPCLALHTMEPPTPTRMARTEPVEGWVDVRLNHFMAYNNDTFRMRYYYNDEFAGNNIVIFVGGEWSISPDWTTGGLPYQLAEKLNAGLFYTEHRYYGETRPFADTSTSNLRFLTIDQALADLAQFIQYVKSDNFNNGQFKDAKVALVGCSYAGTMATWMRLAYPHVVDAAFSDSGPLLAQEDFPEYLEVITEALRAQGGEECLTSVEEGMRGLVELLATANGPATVSEMFNTCEPLNASDPLDLATFFWFGITEAFAYLVQYARPGQIPTACGILTDSSVSDPVQRLANWINTVTVTGYPCIESRYSEVVAKYTDTSFDASGATMRLWTYQTCVEYGWYQTTTSSRQPFLDTVPLEYFHQMCKDLFSPSFDEYMLRSGIERTNLFFGGGYLPDRVVTVLGGHDPWTPMGPNATNAHSMAPLHLVPGISHCRAIQATGTTDIEELEAAKEQVLAEMQYFVTGEWPPSEADNKQAGLQASVALLVAIIGYTLM